MSASSSSRMPDIHSLRLTLQRFTHVPQSLQIIHTVPLKLSSSPSRNTGNAAKTLYILDSSFNPPTRAHLRLCTSALLQDKPTELPKRLLLLLATQNADKALKPAAFEQRLAMMNVFAQEIIDGTRMLGNLKAEDIRVDVAITKEARFIDKAKVIEECGDFDHPGEFEGNQERRPPEQVQLTGFDTLIRLLDTKYYPPNHTLQPLEDLFRKHRIRVTRRVDDEWGGTQEQDDYLQKIERGEKEAEGCKSWWAKRIELVEGRREGEAVISSTKVREAARQKDEEVLKEFVTDGVARWILQEGLYLNDD